MLLELEVSCGIQLQYFLLMLCKETFPMFLRCRAEGRAVPISVFAEYGRLIGTDLAEGLLFACRRAIPGVRHSGDSALHV